MQDGQNVVLCRRDGTTKNIRRLPSCISLKAFSRRRGGGCARLGDIVAVSGSADLNIGETACDPDLRRTSPLCQDRRRPTVSMIFMVNNSPFAGREGKYVTSRNLRDRLFKEVETNVAMRVEEDRYH